MEDLITRVLITLRRYAGENREHDDLDSLLLASANLDFIDEVEVGAGRVDNGKILIPLTIKGISFSGIAYRDCNAARLKPDDGKPEAEKPAQRFNFRNPLN